MTKCNYLTARQVAEVMGICESTAYKVIQKLNAQMEDMGYITISGQVNRNFFIEKVCYGGLIETEQEEVI